MSAYGTTETRVREYDERGQLIAETITTVVIRRVVERPPGFAPDIPREATEDTR